MELENNEAALQNFLEDETLVVGIDADDVGTDPTITLEGVCDSIVSSRTLQCYVGEIMKFLLWCVENKPNWLMANGTDHIAHIMEEHGGEGVHAQRSCTCLIQFPPKMDENWVRYGLAKLGQISRTKLAEDAVLCVHNTASALNR